MSIKAESLSNELDAGQNEEQQSVDPAAVDESVSDTASSCSADAVSTPTLPLVPSVVAVAATPATNSNSTKVRKRKEDKSYDFILRALSSLNSPEEKLAALCQKYADLSEEHRQVKDKVKTTTKFSLQLQRERDHLQSEHSKVVLAKSKLENVCRELQRHNKVIKEDSLTRAKEEEEKRKEVSQKFQTTIVEVQNQMVDCHQRNSKLQEENKELAVKLKGLIDQYEKREEHLDKVYKHKELESQLCEARLAQSSCALQEEQARHGAETERLAQENTLLRKKVELLETQESTLREQIQFYTNKYEEFQDTVSRSNEIFGSVKTEMDKMTKKVKKADKDAFAWKRKFENGQHALLQLAQEKADHEGQMLAQRAKTSKLENLCRALQAERHGASGDASTASPAASPTDAVAAANASSTDAAVAAASQPCEEAQKPTEQQQPPLSDSVKAELVSGEADDAVPEGSDATVPGSS